MKLTPERLAEIHNSTPPRGHIDCGDMATAIWDLLEHVEAVERDLDEFALSVGYGERPEGQSGVHRADLPTISIAFNQARRRLFLEQERAGAAETRTAIADANEERAAIVAWLREQANMLERGAHAKADEVKNG